MTMQVPARYKDKRAKQAMRILLDACVPKRFKLQLPEHEVRTAREVRLNTLEDRQLLDAIAGKFDVLITMDKSIPFQQQLQDKPFALVLLRANSNRLPDLLPLAPKLRGVLAMAKPGTITEVSA
jgi:hypothetical protein